MVVMSGVTAASEVSRAVERLARSGTALTGTVLNEWAEPRLQEELLRQSSRLDRLGTSLAGSVRRWVVGSPLLAQDP
jgi:Mrp family chromosome partitioning ATPase